MVDVIPNRTEIEGEIRSRRDHPSLSDFDLVELDLKDAKPIEGFADLLSSRVGSTIEIAVKRSLLSSEPVEGARLRCRARLGGPGAIFAETDPEPGTFSLIRR
jgi:hypothetical protein